MKKIKMKLETEAEEEALIMRYIKIEELWPNAHALISTEKVIGIHTNGKETDGTLVFIPYLSPNEGSALKADHEKAEDCLNAFRIAMAGDNGVF